MTKTAPAYFWHIPKTGGTSVTAWLQSKFAASLCPAHLADQLVCIPTQDLHRYRIFAGHFHCYLSSYLGAEVVPFTVLRNPIDRTRSHWHHVRRSAAHPHHGSVKFQSFSEFVFDDANRGMIEDYQARYLCGLPINLAMAARSISSADFARFALSEALEQASLPTDKKYLAEGARVVLRRMAVVGVSERLHGFLVQVSKLLGVPAPKTASWENVTVHDEAGTLTTATLARIRDLTRIDQELYQSALRWKQPLLQWNRFRSPSVKAPHWRASKATALTINPSDRRSP